MTTTLVTNIGTMISGDWDTGVLDANAIFIEDDTIAAIGHEDDLPSSGIDVEIDAQGMTVMPGYIDPHTHLPIGDHAPMNRMQGVMQEALYQGITTIVNEWTQFEGIPLFHPPDPEGVKATAITTYRAFGNYRPGGLQKIYGGSIMPVKGLTRDDYAELAEMGISRVGQIGGSTDLDRESLIEQVHWAKDEGMFVSCNFGPGVLKHSIENDLELVQAIEPDKLAHVNGGTTAPSWEEMEELIDETELPLEVIPFGNQKMTKEIVSYLREKDELDRLLVGSDTPTGQGYMPVAVQNAVLFLACLCDLPAEKAISCATGQTKELYDDHIDAGKLDEGMPADLIVVDKPRGSVGANALEALEAGDTLGVGLVMVDGKIAALRGRDTRPTTRPVTINGQEMFATEPNDYLFDPPRFYWESVGQTLPTDCTQ